MTSDEDDFDATEASLQTIRSTSEGARAVAAIESAVKTTAQKIATVAEPVVIAAGKAALPALESFALSMLQSELDKLAGRK